MFRTKTLNNVSVMVAILTASFAIPLTSAETYWVNGECGNDSWPGWPSNCDSIPGYGPKATIQAALDVASYGDTVVVGSMLDPYDEHFEHSIEMKSGVHLRSWTGDPSDMIINGEYQGLVIDCDGLDSNTIIEGFTITGGLAGAGGGIFLQGSSPQIINCVFVENRADVEGGGAMFVHFFSDPTITNCQFIGNSVSSPLPGGGAVWCDWYCNPTFLGCTFTENWAEGDGGAIACTRVCSPTVTSSTFYGNSVVSGTGAGIATDGTAPISMDKTIIAFNNGAEGLTIGDPNSVITCCDIHGNEGGDWVGPFLPGYLSGPYDNICLDPLFCDAPNHDLTLRSDSPCAPANSPGQCDLIGAWPVGCLLGDLDDDCDVDLADLAQLLSNYGMTSGATYEDGDLDGDGDVDLSDLAALLSLYGTTCP